MKSPLARAAIVLGLVASPLSCPAAHAGFVLTTAASIPSWVGSNPHDLAPDGHGGFIGTIGGVFSPTGFSFNPKTGEVLPEFNPGLSTLLPDGNGLYYGTQPGGGPHGGSTVFSYDPATYTKKVLAEFANYNVAANNDLMFDPQGRLIGTTASGNGGKSGTIFSFDPATQELKTLANFDPGNGGPNPGLVSDGHGHYFGTTYAGGTANLGTVFRFDAATGGLDVLTSFTGPNGSYPGTGLVSDGKGGFLGTTGFGGDHNRGSVFRVDEATGKVATISSFNGENGTRPVTRLVADGQGGFLGATNSGDTQATVLGTIFDLNPTSGALTTVGNFIGTFSPPLPASRGRSGRYPIHLSPPTAMATSMGRPRAAAITTWGRSTS